MTPHTDCLQIKRRGFTLLELIVAMTVTLLIVGGLVSITSTALTTFKDSSDNVRNYRQAKAALDQISSDLEAIVVRKGNNYEWLYAGAQNTTDDGANPAKTGTAYFTKLLFLSVVPDRYDGDILANPGDVSCVEYGIEYVAPLDHANAGATNKTFVLYRKLHDPDDTFNDFLAVEPTKTGDEIDLGTGLDNVSPTNTTPLNSLEHIVCENVREMTLVFHVSYTNANGDPLMVKIPVIKTTDSDANKKGRRASAFSITGNGIATDVRNTNASAWPADAANGRVTAIDINLQVLNDSAIALTDVTDTGGTIATKIEQNSRRFSKTIYLPQL